MTFSPASIKALAAALALAALVSGCGRAVGTTLAPDDGFHTLDANQDSRLSKEEAQLSQLAFAGLDKNGDGFLNELEWRGASASDQVPQQIQLNQEARQTPRPGPGTW